MATWKKIITSGSAAELSSLTLDTALPVAQGGIGATSLTDKAVLISQDSGTDAIGAVALTSNGQLIIGGSDGPAAATIGGTSNEIGITNGANSITIGLTDDVTIPQDLTVTRNISNASAVSDSHLTGSFTGSFTGDGSNLTGVGTDIDSLDALGGTGLHQTQDHFLFSDNGTEKKITFSNLEDAIFGNVSGDATIAAGGALTIADNAVSLAKLAGITRGNIIIGDASGDPALLDANDDGKILVGDGNDINSVAVSGDVALANDGAVTIQANAVEGSMLNSNTAGDGLSYGSNALNVDLSGESSVTIGAGTSEVTIGDNLTITGDLTVNGATTTVATTNTKVEDQLMFLGTGSAGTNKDVGIVAQSGSTDLQGSAFYNDTDSERWSVAKSVNHNATSITPLQFVTTVKTDTVNPDTTSGSYGVGEMHVNTSTGEIWIRFG